jgi:phosphoribosylaminoimidazole carboxylase PurE protein
MARTMNRPRVGLVMGSESDRPTMEEAIRVLDDFGVGYEIAVRSAHRTPEAAARWARGAKARGLEVVVAAAGGAAHLAGAMAANTGLPVLGIPLASSPLLGFDALLATVQMPPGVPVGTLGVGAWGARNAAHLAVRILALGDAALSQRLEEHRERLASNVPASDAKSSKTAANGAKASSGKRPRAAARGRS